MKNFSFRFFIPYSGHLIYAFLLIVFSTSFSGAQDYLIHSYTIENGLPSSSVNDITQDHAGRMWFVTRSGIAVYNGLKWKTHTVSSGLPNLNFSKISVDPMGRVWAFAYHPEDGIIYFDGKKWHQITYSSHSNRGRIYIQAAVATKVNNKLTLIIGTKNSGIFLWTDSTWSHIGIDKGLPGEQIYGLAVLEEYVYIATNHGLARMKGGRIDRQFGKHIRELSSVIYGIAVEPPKIDSPGSIQPKIWLHGESWFGFLQDDRLTIINKDVSVPDKQPVSIQPDQKGGVYFGNMLGIFYINPTLGIFKHLGTDNGLLGAGISAIFLDREKNVWFATPRGANKLVSMRFSNFRKKHGLLEDEVTAVWQLKSGKLVFGQNHGITFYDGNRFESLSFSDEKFNIEQQRRVLDICSDLQDNLWVATSDKGMAQIKKDGQIIWYDQKNGLSDYVSSVLVLDNNIWVGSKDGLFIFKNNTFQRAKINRSRNINIRRLFKGPDGTIYIATCSNGIYIYQKNSLKQILNTNNSHANSTYAILNDSRGRLWVGTLAGLFTVQDNSLVKYEKDSFKIDQPVYFIIEDHNNRLWFGTDYGVIRWDGREVKHFTTSQGLAGLETNRAAGFVDRQGCVWIGTDRGVSCYQKEFDYEPQIPPLVRLCRVEASGQKFPLTSPLHLKNSQNNLTFFYRAISYIDEKSIPLKIKLEGFDRDWLFTTRSATQSIRYTNLPPGQYRLHLQAANVMGLWSKVISSSPIFIPKPFWQQWWFYLIILLIVGMVGYSIDYYFSSKRFSRELMKQITERTTQLNASEEKYRSLFKESRDAIYISTLEGKLLDMNPAGVELLGYSSKEELLRIDLAKDLYVDAADRLKLQKQLDKNNFVKDYQLNIKTKQGKELTVLLSSTTARDENGKIIGYRGIIRDVTEQKKLEQQFIQAQKMESIGLLAGGIAHDFNNILGSILGYASLVKMKMKPTHEFYREIDIIEISSQRAAELTNQLLAFARGGRYKGRPINLNKIILETVNIIQSTFDKAIEIKTNLLETLPTVEADSGQMHQVIMNLCLNARDAMPFGGKLI
ncbi:MAG: two-component regulator propeller domain-containing protein, partial [Calditrichia bacterium]